MNTTPSTPTPAECAERRAICERAWEDAGRDPADLTFSVMVPWLMGSDKADLARRAERLAAWQGSEPTALIEEFGQVGVAGTLAQAAERLGAYREAGAAGVQPVDGVFSDFRDGNGLPRRSGGSPERRLARQARYSPGPGAGDECGVHPVRMKRCGDAEEIVAAFEAQPDAGVLSIGGKMVDRPHLVQARRVLERADGGN